MKKILFIDRDGTVIVEPEDKQVDRLDKVALAPDVIGALHRLRESGFEFVMVSNQDGRGTDSFPENDFVIPHQFLMGLLKSQGIEFLEELICPHFSEDNCDCRKPKTGLLTKFLAQTHIDVESSYVIGDRDADLGLAQNLGVKGIKIDIDNNGWAKVVDQLTSPYRQGYANRKSNETDITVAVDLDSEAKDIRVSTGLGFFDHMLEQLAKHGGFGLTLTCTGDLHIDEHHTVEDCALCIGEALRNALGTKKGISRYGFLIPMDETEVQVSIDLSARPFFSFDGQFSRGQVGEMSTQMVPHFFKSLSDTLGATLHIKMRGDNAHHQVEGMFKAVGRSLRQAFTVEGKELPTTKGML
ncbi:MAG: bifunctional histidinol-phosphatase/imidazoleglycerol-phosphate dehydratase HisB [Pseudomonadota bacterium]